MIKNQDIVRKAEDDYLSTHILTPEKALNRMSDMYEFYRQYGIKTETESLLSRHVETLIALSCDFRKIYVKQQEKQ